MFGQYEKAVEAAKKALGIDPDFVFGYVTLATAYQFLDRMEEAEATLQRASERKLDIPEGLVQRYDIAFLRGDQAGMERAAARCQGKSEAEGWISTHQALVLAYTGQLRQSRAMSRRAVDLATQAGQLGTAAKGEAVAALLEAFFGNVPETKQDAMAVLKLSRDRDSEYGAAFALALSGDSSGAQTLANDLAKRFPEDTSVNFSYLPELRALLSLKGEPRKGIEALQVAVPYDLGVPESWSTGYFGAMYSVYMRGEVYLAAHQGAEAAVEFQKILDHRGIVAPTLSAHWRTCRLAAR